MYPPDGPARSWLFPFGAPHPPTHPAARNRPQHQTSPPASACRLPPGHPPPQPHPSLPQALTTSSCASTSWQGAVWPGNHLAEMTPSPPSAPHTGQVAAPANTCIACFVFVLGGWGGGQRWGVGCGGGQRWGVISMHESMHTTRVFMPDYKYGVKNFCKQNPCTILASYVHVHVGLRATILSLILAICYLAFYSDNTRQDGKRPLESFLVS